MACSICIHKDRPAIDRFLVAGGSLRDAVGHFSGTSRSSLHRHRQTCLAASLARATVRAATTARPDLPTWHTSEEDALLKLAEDNSRLEEAKEDELLDAVRELTVTGQRILATAEKAGQLSVALNAMRELRSVFELLLKVAGRLNQSREAPVYGPAFVLPVGSQVAVLIQPPQRAENNVTDGVSIKSKSEVSRFQ